MSRVPFKKRLDGPFDLRVVPWMTSTWPRLVLRFGAQQGLG